MVGLAEKQYVLVKEHRNTLARTLLLREIRADLKAAKQVDPLTLAESLLKVVQNPLTANNCFTACFSLPVAKNRLAQRVDALISNKPLPTSPSFIYWSWLLLLLIPWATVPLHY